MVKTREYQHRCKGKCNKPGIPDLRGISILYRISKKKEVSQSLTLLKDMRFLMKLLGETCSEWKQMGS